MLPRQRAFAWIEAPGLRVIKNRVQTTVANILSHRSISSWTMTPVQLELNQIIGALEERLTLGQDFGTFLVCCTKILTIYQICYCDMRASARARTQCQ